MFKHITVKKKLSVFIVALLVISFATGTYFSYDQGYAHGYIQGLAEAGGTPTIDGTEGISNMPWVNATAANFEEFYLNSEDKTDLLEYPEQGASYTIFKDESTHYAKNGETGQIDYTNMNATALIMSVFTELDPAGGKIVIRASFDDPILINGIDLTPANTSIIGVGEVDWTTSNGGANILSLGLRSGVENIFFHENNIYKHTVIFTEQYAVHDRYWTAFPKDGGSITGTPLMIFDGHIITENAGYVYASHLMVDDGVNGYGIDVTTNGRLQVRNLADDKKTQNMGAISVTGAVSSYIFQHQMSGTPNVIMLTPQQSGQGNWFVGWGNSTHIYIGFVNQPGASTWYFYWWASV